MASSYSFSSSLNRSSKKSTVNDPKTCDCGFPARILTSATPKNPGRHFMVCNKGKCKYWKWLDVEPVQMLVMEVVEGMKAELVALKTEVEKVKEDMKHMKKEKHYLNFLLEWNEVILTGMESQTSNFDWNGITKK
ncbi:unnamed protein product [Lactuca virosa]|uniref:GRF-type domain-containing protein n=1 Tax=Lactuca virosa TaxID=75947 RepID=A0AAU9MDB0_9ASTR|nr:unnamed protein product [Lactuca virosa]